MRPRTATIQVWKEDNLGWCVEIGNTKDSTPSVMLSGQNLILTAKRAVLVWIEKEKLLTTYGKKD